MMPSVIPARLQFQCGHAALVTLPRVKGETATQRNDRVAREKTAALARQCDFCVPSVAVLEPPSTVVDMAHVELAVSDVVEPTPVSDLAVVVTNVPDTTSGTEHPSSEVDSEPASPAEAALTEVVEVVEVEPEPAEPEAPQEEVVVEEIIVTQIEETPAEEAPDEMPLPVVEAPEPEARPVRKPRARRQPRPVAPTATPARGRRASRARVPAPAPTRSGHQFVVEYQVERVVRAVSIRDALRQASALGATDLIAITRAD